jgi:hypothetical protein
MMLVTARVIHLQSVLISVTDFFSSLYGLRSFRFPQMLRLKRKYHGGYSRHH